MTPLARAAFESGMTKINAPKAEAANDEDGKEEKLDEDGKPLKSSRNKKKKNKK